VTKHARSVQRVKANSHRHVRHDKDGTVLSCLVWRCELSRPGRPTSVFCVGRVCRAAQCDRPTRSDAERTFPAVSSHRHTRQDKTVSPAYRPPPLQRSPGSGLRLATRPPTARQQRCRRHENVNTLWTAALGLVFIELTLDYTIQRLSQC